MEQGQVEGGQIQRTKQSNPDAPLGQAFWFAKDADNADDQPRKTEKSKVHANGTGKRPQWSNNE